MAQSIIPEHSPRFPNRGFALVTTLALLGVLSLIALSSAQQSRFTETISSNYKNKINSSISANHAVRRMLELNLSCAPVPCTVSQPKQLVFNNIFFGQSLTQSWSADLTCVPTLDPSISKCTIFAVGHATISGGGPNDLATSTSTLVYEHDGSSITNMISWEN